MTTIKIDKPNDPSQLSSPPRLFIPYHEIDGHLIRDIGNMQTEKFLPVNPYSQENNNPIRTSMLRPVQDLIIAFREFKLQYNYLYEFQPRSWRIHRSPHYFSFFCISVYLPWRYEAQIKNIAIRWSGMNAASTIRNSILRKCTLMFAYTLSIFMW